MSLFFCFGIIGLPEILLIFDGHHFIISDWNMKLEVSPFLLLICWMTFGVIVTALTTQSASLLNKILILTFGAMMIALALIIQHELQ